jgi:hypothetical protein
MKIEHMFKLINLYFKKTDKILIIKLPINYMIYKCLQLNKLNILSWEMYFSASYTILNIWDDKWKDICNEFKWKFYQTD